MHVAFGHIAHLLQISLPFRINREAKMRILGLGLAALLALGVAGDAVAQ